jgi:hypothetical protein
MVFASLLNATAVTIKLYLAGCRPQFALTHQNVVLICLHFVVLLTFLRWHFDDSKLRKDYHG